MTVKECLDQHIHNKDSLYDHFKTVFTPILNELEEITGFDGVNPPNVAKLKSMLISRPDEDWVELDEKLIQAMLRLYPFGAPAIVMYLIKKHWKLEVKEEELCRYFRSPSSGNIGELKGVERDGVLDFINVNCPMAAHD